MMLAAEAAGPRKNDIFMLYIPADFRFLNSYRLGHGHPPDPLTTAAVVAAVVAVVGQFYCVFCCKQVAYQTYYEGNE